MHRKKIADIEARVATLRAESEGVSEAEAELHEARTTIAALTRTLRMVEGDVLQKRRHVWDRIAERRVRIAESASKIEALRLDTTEGTSLKAATIESHACGIAEAERDIEALEDDLATMAVAIALMHSSVDA